MSQTTDPSGSDSTQQQQNTSMEQLESQHQMEIFQQQQEHLHQLQVLQAQLLQELSTHLPVGSDSTSDAAFPQFQQELQGVPDVSSQQLNVSSHGGVQPHSLPIEITGSRRPWGDVPLSWPAIQQQPIATSMTSTLPDNYSPPISRSDSPREAPIQDTSSITISPAQSLEFLQLPSPVKTIPITSTATSSPITKPASHTTPDGVFSSLVEVGDRDVSKSPTGSEIMTTPMKPLRQSFKEQLQSPPFTAFTIPSHMPLPQSAFSPATQGKSPSQSATQGKSPSQGNTRTALLDKHNKHVADLKQYYETEMAGLKREMEELRLQVDMQQAPSSLWSHQDVAEREELTSG